MTAEIATFANGCFWGTEHIFNKFYKTHGIIRTAVGYTGGYREEPSYEEVCSGRTGHAESVQVVFNPDVVGYAELVGTPAF
jgi:peptide-methionine (S)-S-oxide reductase